MAIPYFFLRLVSSESLNFCVSYDTKFPCDGHKDVVKYFYKCRLTLSLGITRSVMQQFTPTSFILSHSVSTVMLLKEEGSLLVPDTSC